jgi:hypothetical protein
MSATLKKLILKAKQVFNDKEKFQHEQFSIPYNDSNNNLYVFDQLIAVADDLPALNERIQLDLNQGITTSLEFMKMKIDDNQTMVNLLKIIGVCTQAALGKLSSQSAQVQLAAPADFYKSTLYAYDPKNRLVNDANIYILDVEQELKQKQTLQKYYNEESQKFADFAAKYLQQSQDLPKDFDVEFSAYCELLARLRVFQQTYYPDRPELLDVFKLSATYKNINDHTVEVLWKNNFKALFNSLANLSDVIPEQSSLLHTPLRDALLNAMLLTEHLVKKKPDKYASQQVLALANNIQAAADFAVNPLNEQKKNNLFTTTEEMRLAITPYTATPETRFVLGITAAVITMIGLAVAIAAVLLGPVPLFPLLIVAGVELTTIGAVTLGMSIWPTYPDKEDPLAHNIRSSLKQISQPPRQWFFSRATPAVQPVQQEQQSSVNPGMGMSVSGGSFTG